MTSTKQASHLLLVGASIVLATLSMGCIAKSLRPFYTEDSLCETPKELLGKWYVHYVPSVHTAPPGIYQWQKIEPWVISKDTALTYDFGNTPMLFDIRFFKIGKHLFCDSRLSPFTFSADEGEFSESVVEHLVPIHCLSKVTLTDGSLMIDYLDVEQVVAVAKRGEAKLANLELVGSAGGSTVVFTASPQEWQAFLGKHGRDKQFFPLGLILKRKPFDPKKVFDGVKGG